MLEIEKRCIPLKYQDKDYNSASLREKRAMEIRDLGYPLTKANDNKPGCFSLNTLFALLGFRR